MEIYKEEIRDLLER